MEWVCFVDKDVAAFQHGRYQGSWSIGRGYSILQNPFFFKVNGDSQTYCIEYSDLRV